MVTYWTHRMLTCYYEPGPLTPTLALPIRPHCFLPVTTAEPKTSCFIGEDAGTPMLGLLLAPTLLQETPG